MDARNVPLRAQTPKLLWEEGIAGAALTGAAPSGLSPLGAWVGPISLAPAAPMGTSSSSSAGKGLADEGGDAAPELPTLRK